ncbi:MAG: hypothetical protein ACOCWM_02280 [Cyclobacteriaceae bacterium]
MSTIAIVIWARFAPESLRPELYGIAIGLTIAMLIELIVFLIRKWSLLRVYAKCYFPLSSKEIRLTIAYLFKIECHGKYLLVKSKRIPNTYQPVGGVYKYFSPEADNILSKMTIIPDNSIPNDGYSEHDLRVKMKNRCHVPLFLKWFFELKQRELSPWREFYEELVATKILPAKIFSYMFYDLIGQHLEQIHFDPHFRIDTLKYADIYIPRYSSDEQRFSLKKLAQQVNDDQYIWATENEIINKFTHDGKRIADHTCKIFHTKTFQ